MVTAKESPVHLGRHCSPVSLILLVSSLEDELCCFRSKNSQISKTGLKQS
ncbi:unnamed protein product [Brassica rapa subsp. trilocularis]